MRQLYLVSYDIRHCGRRARVLRTLKGNAIGGQKSVYECWLDQGEFKATKNAVDRLIDAAEDRVLFTRLDRQAAIHTLGIGTPPEDGHMFFFG